MAQDPTLQEQTVAISFKEFRDEKIVDFFSNENRSFCSDPVQDDRLTGSRIVGAPHFSRSSINKLSKKPSAAFQPFVQIHDAGSDNVFSNEKENDHPKSGAFDSATGENRQPIIRVARLGEREKKERKKTAEPSFGKPTRPLGALLSFGDSSSKENRAAKIVCDPLDKKSRKFDVLKKKRFSGAPVFQTEIRDNTIFAPGKNRPFFGQCSRGTASLWKRNDSPNTPNAMDQNDIVAFPAPEKTQDSLIDRLNEADSQLKNLIESWPKLSNRLKETINALVEVSNKETNS